jgi:long-subunit fatty acid transport protein
LDNLLLAADLTYYDWRPYRDDAGRELSPPMNEIVVPRIGLEYYVIKDLALRTGYSFQKSPLPQQPIGYPTNLLDNDVHTLSWGLGYFWNVFGLLPRPAQWSVFYELQILASRTFHNVHPDQPDLRSSGMFHSFGFSIHFYL